MFISLFWVYHLRRISGSIQCLQKFVNLGSALFQQKVQPHSYLENKKPIIVSSTIGKQLLFHLVMILVISPEHAFISIQRQTRACFCHVADEVSILEAVRTFNLPTTLTAAFAQTKKIRCCMDPGVLSTNKRTAFFSFEIFCFCFMILS